MRRLLLVATLTAVTPWAVAQGTSSDASHSTAPVSAPAHADAPATLVRSLMSKPDSGGFPKPHHSRAYLPLLSALGMFSDIYPNPNSSSGPDPSAAAFPSAAQAPNILLQALAPAATQQPSASQPLLIELQGDRYVQLTGGDTSANDLTYQAPAASAARSGYALPNLRKQSARDVSPRVLSPVALVFRDGHNEEVRDYTIAGGVIYVRGDYYSDGYWNKKIELSALNLAETFKSNRQRGIRFVLPTAPNEIITRP